MGQTDNIPLSRLEREAAALAQASVRALLAECERQRSEIDRLRDLVLWLGGDPDSA